MTVLRIGNKTYSEVIVTGEQEIVYKGETYKLVKVTSVTSPEVTETYYSLMHKRLGMLLKLTLKNFNILSNS